MNNNDKKLCEGYKANVKENVTKYTFNIIGHVVKWVLIIITFTVVYKIISSFNRFQLNKMDQEFVNRQKPWPLVPKSLEELVQFLHSELPICNRWYSFQTQNIEWNKQASLCLDYLPDERSPKNCRTYSIAYDAADITSEAEIGTMGCRVHLWGHSTKLNYAILYENLYFYPLDIGPISGPALYSYDDYLNLVGHEQKRISYIRTTTKGGEMKFLDSLFASKIRAWERIHQIRMVVTFPHVTRYAWMKLMEPYQRLANLSRLGFSLIKSRKNEKTIYNVKSLNTSISTEYEMVWLNTMIKI